MKNILLSGIFFMLVLPGTALAQEYSYTRYDIAEGLAGSTIYCITQDKDGFIWVGTEAGVSRFDGAHFLNFTTKDGLPDLEILQIFGDSKGRVWMAPFRKSVCYYYQGKIHNEKNDSLLSRIRLRNNVESFAEDPRGDILIQERTAVQVLRTDGSLVQLDSIGHAPITDCMVSSVSATGNFQAQIGPSIVEFSPTGSFLKKTAIAPPLESPRCIMMNSSMAVWQPSGTGFNIRLLSTGREIRTTVDQMHNPSISYSVMDDSLIYSNGSEGAVEFNLNTGRKRQFLPGITVNRVFRDAFGNIWFTTMGKGLYRLNSDEIKTVRLSAGKDDPSSITAMTKLGNELWVGDDHEFVFQLSLPDMTLKKATPFTQYAPQRILFIDSIGKDRVITGSDFGLIEGTRDLRPGRIVPGGFKSAVRIGDRSLLVGHYWGAAIYDLRDIRITDTLCRERTTAVFNAGDTIYIGTLNGLYRRIGNGPLKSLGDSTPFLKRRISSIAESSDGTLWIASYDDAGIIGYKDGRQTAVITSREGLTSDFCRTLLVRGNTLWAGTDRGLCRITLDQPEHPIKKITSRDGLASDMVNVLYVDGPMVYVGTPEGLSYFDDRNPDDPGYCLLYLTALTNGDRDRIPDTSRLIVPYTDTHVRFQFAGISYKSAGDITYRYRMAGLNDKWRETKENFLEYPELPAGSYEFQLTAVNKFGTPSRLLTIPVEVTAQFWKRTWFIVTAWLTSLGLLWLLVSLRVRRIRRRGQEKERLVREMNQLKNNALKSQMNPHFIFNCLNSIQHSIFAGDTNAANSYIAGLARLIRMTLNDSSRSFVSIADEIDYLGLYLQMEKMRFKEKLDYELRIDPSIDQQGMLIPPMLVQPHVENALLHGLGQKTEGKGRISIHINKKGDRLNVVVEDNGVGRAATENHPRPADHHSQGMSITEGRLDMLSRLYDCPFSVTIFDLKDSSDQPSGTRIIIDLPLFLESSLYT